MGPFLHKVFLRAAKAWAAAAVMFGIQFAAGAQSQTDWKRIVGAVVVTFVVVFFVPNAAAPASSAG